MFSFEPKKYRILPNNVYDRIMNVLKTKDSVSRFSMEDGVLKEQLRTQKAPCIPFSFVKDQVPTEFTDFDIGEGEEILAERLQTVGMAEGEARGTAYAVYKHIIAWVILPMSVVEKIPSQMKGDRVFLEPGTFAKADAFAKWITEIQILDPVEPKQNKPKPELSEETKAHRAALKAHASGFKESYMLMSDETYDGWYAFVKEKPGQTYTKKLSIYKEPVVYRIVEAGRMFAACGDFTKEKEVLSSTMAQPHLPEELRGYGFGEGPDVLYASLRKGGIDKEDASDITKQIYDIIPKCVILPAEGMNAMAVSAKNGVLMTDAVLLNKAFDMYEWLN
jgi:hypothetical protein